MDILKNKKVKARKPHGCNLCGGRIKKGEIHHYQFNTYRGEHWEHRGHDICTELCSMLDLYGEPEGVDCEFFQESIDDEFYRYINERLPSGMDDIIELLSDVNYYDKAIFLYGKIEDGEINAPNNKLKIKQNETRKFE